MQAVLSRPRRLLFAAVTAGIVAAAAPARAQQPAVNPSPPAQPPVPSSAQPGAGPGSQPLTSPAPAPSAQAPTTPPPSWAQGRPDSPAAANIAPIAPPPIPTPADKLPVATLKLPKGFNLEVYSAGLTNARSLRVDDKGNVYVSTRLKWPKSSATMTCKQRRTLRQATGAQTAGRCRRPGASRTQSGGSGAEPLRRLPSPELFGAGQRASARRPARGLSSEDVG